MTTQLPIHSTAREPDRSPAAAGGPRLAPAPALMTDAGLEAVRGELARLRRSSRLEIEQRLGQARAYGAAQTTMSTTPCGKTKWSSRRAWLHSTRPPRHRRRSG